MFVTFCGVLMSGCSTTGASVAIGRQSSTTRCAHPIGKADHPRLSASQRLGKEDHGDQDKPEGGEQQPERDRSVADPPPGPDIGRDRTAPDAFGRLIRLVGLGEGNPLCRIVLYQATI